MSDSTNQKIEIELIPNFGLKDIPFGISREDVKEIMAKKFGEIDIIQRSSETDCYLRNSLQFTYEYDDTLTFIETAAPPPIYVKLLGINTWEIPGNDLLNMLCNYDLIDIEASSKFGFRIFKNKHMVLWGLDIQYDQIGGYKIPKWGSIAIGDKRYYEKLLSL